MEVSTVNLVRGQFLKVIYAEGHGGSCEIWEHWICMESELQHILNNYKISSELEEVAGANYV